VVVFKDVESAHTVAAFPRHLRHKASGLSFAENEDEHVFTSCQGSEISFQ
jgi:hypothetical protein